MGIKYLSEAAPKRHFEEIYLKVRNKEGRILDDQTVARLPFVNQTDVDNYKEWALRARSFNRLRQYFKGIVQTRNLLDIGCGNGWAAARLAANPNLQITAVDINETELVQAERVFRKPNLNFCYGNIFEDIFPPASFDYIILNSSAQYFNDIGVLIRRLFYFLKDDGEIHILDTPFYQSAEIYEARARTKQYYRDLGFPDMAAEYFHHRMDDLESFRYEIKSGTGILQRLDSIIGNKRHEHFPWICIRK